MAGCQNQPPEVFYKKTVLKNFAISTGNTCVGVYFSKSCRPAGLQQVFSCEYCEIFDTVLKNICKRLLFNLFNGLLLHGPKGLRSRLYDGVRLQGPSHRPSLLFFKSASLVLRAVPTYIRKLKTNTFDKSIKFLHWLFLVVLDGFRSL